jgi:hypothetical protein
MKIEDVEPGTEVLQHLIEGLAVAGLRKAEKEFLEITRWYIQELQAGRPPIDLRVRAAGNYYAAAEKLRKLNPKPLL